MSEQSKERVDAEDDASSGDRQFARFIRWAFGEIRVPRDTRFQRRLNFVTIAGLLCWVLGMAARFAPLIFEDSMSKSLRRNLELAGYALIGAGIIIWIVFPTIWYVRYGSRFGRRPP